MWLVLRCCHMLPYYGETVSHSEPAFKIHKMWFRFSQPCEPCESQTQQWHSQFWVLVWLCLIGFRVPFAPQKRMLNFCDFLLFWIDFWRLRMACTRLRMDFLPTGIVSSFLLGWPIRWFDDFWSLDRAPWVPKWVKIAASLDGIRWGWR